jgi:hypothetical protein
MDAPTHPAFAGTTYHRLTSPDPSVWNRAWVELARLVSIVVAGVTFLGLLAVGLLFAIGSPPAGFAVLLVYFGACVVVNAAIWLQTGLWEHRLTTSGFAPLKDSLVLWGVLGLIFGLAAGGTLLIVLLRRNGLLPGPVGTPVGSPPTASAHLPPPYPLPPPPPPAMPAGTSSAPAALGPSNPPPPTAPPVLCPRCHLPSTFVAQYQRSYCYHCAMYL